MTNYPNVFEVAKQIAIEYKICASRNYSRYDRAEAERIKDNDWKRMKKLFYTAVREWWFVRNDGRSIVSVKMQGTLKLFIAGDFNYLSIYNHQNIIGKGAMNLITINSSGETVSIRAVSDYAFIAPADRDLARFVLGFMRNIAKEISMVA